MKKVFIYIMTAVLSFGMTSCDKIFDNLEGDLSKMTAENLLSSEAGLKGLLANLYNNIPIVKCFVGFILLRCASFG